MARFVPGICGEGDRQVQFGRRAEGLAVAGGMVATPPQAKRKATCSC